MSRLAAVIAGLAAITALSCERVASEGDAVVVSLGEREVTRAALDRFITSRTELGGTLDAPLLSALLDEYVREQLLVIAAEEEGVEVSEVQLLAETSALRRGPGPGAVLPEDAAAPETTGGESEDSEDARLRSQVRDRLLVERLMDTVVLAGVEATEEALQLEFEANRAFYARPETVTLAERRFDDRESAEAAAERLREERPSGDDDDAGELFLPVGSFRRGELPEAVEQAVFGLDPGDVTDAVETAAGFRVFRVDRRLSAAALDFEEVEDVVRLTVLRQEADIRVQTLLDDLQNRHPVRVHAENLAFPYVGMLPKAE